jgi:hypothetical protein
LAITPLEETWALFRRRVEKPPERTLERIGTIHIAHLQEIGHAHADKPMELTVEAVPLDGYPSHAEIPQAISRGLANKIVAQLRLHDDER